MEDNIKKYLSENGKKSWDRRKSPEELLRLKEISAKGVEARKRKKIGTV